MAENTEFRLDEAGLSVELKSTGASMPRPDGTVTDGPLRLEDVDVFEDGEGRRKVLLREARKGIVDEVMTKMLER